MCMLITLLGVFETTTKVKGSKVKISGSEDGKLKLNQKLNAVVKGRTSNTS